VTAGQRSGHTAQVTTTDRADRSHVGAVLLGVTVLVAVATVFLDVRAVVTDADRGDLELGWTSLLAGLAMAVPGALLLGRLPRHAVAWVLTIGGMFWAVNGLAASWLVNATAEQPALPGASLAFYLLYRAGAWLPAPGCWSYCRCCWCSSPTVGCRPAGGVGPRWRASRRRRCCRWH